VKATHNREYKKIIKEERYLSMEMKMRDRKTLVRFRCGNEVSKGKRILEDRGGKSMQIMQEERRKYVACV